ncbi:MAG TPA: prepilin peptidase [Candidatus Paceibacterota bacterium]|jgi:leader peptidase (prepilin peptidase)/N-methyltransferase|nr:prepilin peptidase [Candidatus Paceibacterota bacterium]
MILIPIFLFALIFFCLGLIIGSFLNVVIYRMNTGKSLGGRSACMSCLNKLSWYELIPLFSFVGLKGRCKNCKTKISIQYPLVEFITGLIFAALFLKFFSLGITLGRTDAFFVNTSIFIYMYYAIMFSLLVIIAVYDLKHKIIPDKLSFVFGVLAFLGLFFFTANNFFAFPPHIPTLLEFLSGPLIALPFAFFWLISRGRWMGLGDAKLALGLGWFLGLASGLSALVIAFWLGAIIGLCLIVFRKGYGMKSEIPFAPYLIFGALLAFIFGLNLFVL